MFRPDALGRPLTNDVPGVFTLRQRIEMKPDASELRREEFWIGTRDIANRIEMKAMQAYLTGRVKVKASFSDLLFAKSLIG